MLQLTIGSGVAAFLLAILIPKIPIQLRRTTLILCLIVIFYLTLWRGNQSIRHINLSPFGAYRRWRVVDVRWQIYMNVFLFMPYGAILKLLNFRHAIRIAFVTSILIEFTQYIFALGLCEIDDVINNTLGAVIGCGLYAQGFFMKSLITPCSPILLSCRFPQLFA